MSLISNGSRSVMSHIPNGSQFVMSVRSTVGVGCQSLRKVQDENKEGEDAQAGNFSPEMSKGRGGLSAQV